MTMEGFVEHVCSTYTPEEIVALLIRYGVCDEYEITDALAEYIVELEDCIFEEY